MNNDNNDNNLYYQICLYRSIFQLLLLSAHIISYHIISYLKFIVPPLHKRPWVHYIVRNVHVDLNSNHISCVCSMFSAFGWTTAALVFQPSGLLLCCSLLKRYTKV